jgi:diguanylate cyclase (GGDEF)-like protein/PAS domain S-box-containing protein
MPHFPNAIPAFHLERLHAPERLAALDASRLLDSDADEAFDRFTRLAARWLSAPTALVSLVDDHRQFFKSAIGLGEPWATLRETPLSHSFCQYAVTTGDALVVEDARMHPVLRDNLAVTELDVIAYAGVPLVTSDDHVLGSLCVIDKRPRPWTEDHIDVLRDLAALTMAEVELRAQLARLNALRAERGKERRLLHAVLDAIDDPLIVSDRDGRILLANLAARRNRPDEVLKTVEAFAGYGIFQSDGRTPFDAKTSPIARALSGEQVRDADCVVAVPGIPPRNFAINASPLRDVSSEIVAAVSVGRDVTAARQAQAALARSESILRSVVRNLPNGAVLLFDRDLRYLMADGEQLLNGIGLKREDLVGRTLYEVATPQGLPVVEPYYRAALAGESGSLELKRGDQTYAITLVPVREENGDVSAGLAMVYDITSHKHGEELARQEAEHVRSISVRDELTGLYNRRGFLDLARQQLTIARQMERPALLFFVDLNGMKLINDKLGHEQGDRALVETADVLRTTFRGSDILARLGGDEFVALLMDSHASQLAIFTERVEREIEARNDQPGRAYRLSASIGCAPFDPSQPASVDELLARADALMYEQKRSRKPIR